MKAEVRPPDQVREIIAEITKSKVMREGIETMMTRADEMPSMLTTKLAGIYMEPHARRHWDEKLDAWWAGNKDSLKALANGAEEIIVGAGVHAAVYCGVRAMMGAPKPLVLEMGDRVGGSFAYCLEPAFFVNSRNRPGGLGTPGRREALNFLPGAAIQPSDLGCEEYQPNTALAFAVRATLAMYGRVVTGVEVKEALGTGTGVILADGEMITVATTDPFVSTKKRDPNDFTTWVNGDIVSNGGDVAVFDGLNATRTSYYITNENIMDDDGPDYSSTSRREVEADLWEFVRAGSSPANAGERDSKNYRTWLPGDKIIRPGANEAEAVVDRIMDGRLYIKNQRYCNSEEIEKEPRPVSSPSSWILVGEKSVKANEDKAVRAGGTVLKSDRVIFATGLGKPRGKFPQCNRVLDYPSFMRKFEEPFPLKGMQRVAVIGSGDSANTVVEALLGLGPARGMSVASMDYPERIDWYGPTTDESTKEGFIRCNRSRYTDIARSLPSEDAKDNVEKNRLIQSARVDIISRKAQYVEPSFNGATVDGAYYDMVIDATGFQRRDSQGIQTGRLYELGDRAIARIMETENTFAVGPCTNLKEERRYNLPEAIPENDVAIFRFADRTAVFAQQMPVKKKAKKRKKKSSLPRRFQNLDYDYNYELSSPYRYVEDDPYA